MLLRITAIIALLFIASTASAESQENEYRGITDPFGDPANYEFAEDEKEDKEFFHLGRYLMFGIDLGAGVFTMGLGKSAGAAFYGGARMIYFFDKHIGFEFAIHYARHLDQVRPTEAGFADIDTQLIPITGAFRYYFDTKDAPRALAIANPYLVFGAGNYIRTLRVLNQNLSLLEDGEGPNFGLNGGGGLEFSIYRRHIYLGVDVRYHAVFFDDEDGIIDIGTGLPVIPSDNRSGDYITTAITLTYNF